MARDDKTKSRYITSGDRFGGAQIGPRGVDAKTRQEYALIATNKPEYMPASSKELGAHDMKMDTMGKKLDDIYERVCGRETDLLEPEYVEFEVKASRIHVITLCASLVLASLLIFIGIIAPLINGLPHRLFWLSMGLPAAGVAAANILILLGGREEKD